MVCYKRCMIGWLWSAVKIDTEKQTKEQNRWKGYSKVSGITAGIQRKIVF